MPQVDPVILQLKADVDSYNLKVGQAQKLTDQRLGDIERKVGQTEATITKGFAGMGSAVKSFAASLLTIRTVQELARLADTAKNIDAQLRLATRASGDFAKAQDDVRKIAAETRSGLEDTAQLYGKLQLNSRELGITQDQAGRATETVSKAFKISGASAVEASQGTRQLVQALQSGVLRGDEFNTMAEAAPRLQRLLADSLGVTQGELRKMAEAGELTSDRLVRAFTDKKFTDGLDAEFKQMPVTFDQAMTQIENAAITTFGAFDRGGQFSNDIANFIVDGVHGFGDLESAAQAFGNSAAAEIAGLIALGGQLINQLNNIHDAFGLLDAARSVGLSRLNDIAGYANPAGLAVRGLGAAAANTPEARERARAGRVDTIAGQLDKGFSVKGFLNSGAPAPAPRITPSGGGGGHHTGGGGSAKIDRTPEQRAQELARLETDELNARMDLATDAGERADIAKQLLERERAELIRRLGAKKVLTPEMQGLIDTLYGKPGNDPGGEIVGEGKPGLLQQKVNRDLLDQQNKLSNDMLTRQADTLAAWTDIETNTQKRNELEQSALALHQMIEKNLLDQQIATGQVADAEKAQAGLASQQTAARIRLQRSQMSPGQKYADDLRTSAENVNDAIENIQVEGLKSLNDGLADAIMGAKSLGDVFHDVAGQIIADLLRIAIQKSIIGPITNALFGGGSLLGGAAVGAKQSLKLAGRASGGPVNAGEFYRVNEGAGAGRVEGFIPRGSGEIVPLGRMNAAAGGGGNTVIQHFHLHAEGAVMTEQLLAEMDSKAQAAAAVGANVGHMRARQDMASIGRPRL